MAETTDLGDGFQHHGPVSDVAQSRGMVCTEDGEGNPVVLVWLFDHRYAYALGVINAETGEMEEIPRPIDRDCPFASLLAQNGRYYTYFGGHFIEFDPKKREFTAVHEGPPRVAMSMTEDYDGVIWAAIYPGSEVVSYNPATDEMRNYGCVHEHPSTQYPRYVAADDEGWVYVAVGLAAGQIIMLNSDTGETKTVVPEDEIVGKGRVRVYPYVNGRVYGYAPSPADGQQWYELYDGEARKMDGAPDVEQKNVITGTQGLRHRDLPNGERVQNLDLIEGRLVVKDPKTDETREMEFETSGEGGAAMSVAAMPDGTVAGGTYIPHRFFSYDPRTDEWTRHECYAQWNTITAAEDLVYIGTYTEGVLLQWDPAQEWVTTQRDNPDSNPRYLAQTRAHPDIGRPYALLAHPDGRHIILGGFPGYGYTGGGLVFYDEQTDTAEIIGHKDLIPWHSTMSLLALPDGRLLGGTTPLASNGGVRKAEGPGELYILDMNTKAIVWHDALIDGVERYDNMVMGPDGKVFGIADRTRLFVFDPVEKKILHEADFEEDFGPTVYQQGPRIFVKVPDGRIFILFGSSIGQLNPETHEVTTVAEPPMGLGQGGAYLDGRIYFAGGDHGAHLYSWQVPPAE
ncbi:MAG: PQQ-binding-like beta-propeller repeat protein [Armatimonadota bacterium]